MLFLINVDLYFTIYDIDLYLLMAELPKYLLRPEIVVFILFTVAGIFRTLSGILSVSFSPCPDVIYILACAPCFLAVLVYLPRTTASLWLHSHIAAFGVFTVSFEVWRRKEIASFIGVLWGNTWVCVLRSESFSPSQLFPVGCPLCQWMALSSGRTSLSVLESHSLVILVSDWPTLSRCQHFVKNLGGGARWRPALAASVSSWAPQSVCSYLHKRLIKEGKDKMCIILLTIWSLEIKN